MAHENLKFSLDLNNKNWQPILGNQDYGTFYMIYIQIKEYRKEQINLENEPEKYKYVYDCDFRIQNFRGEITMGFAGVPSIKIKKKKKPNTKLNKVDIMVSLTLKIAPFVFNEYNSMCFEEENPMEHGFIMRTKLKRFLPPTSLYDRNNPKKAAYLDPYRFKRDGDDIIEIASRAYKSKEPFTSLINNGIGGGSGLGICSPDLSLILINN